MLITISGLSGSGKSSAAQGLSEKLGMPTVDAGAIFRRMAKERGMTVSEFGRYADKHRKIDLDFDKRLIRMAKRRKTLILQGRLTGMMTARYEVPAIRIWIGATARTRAGRIAGREGKSVAVVAKETAARDRDNRARYLRTYGLDLNDLSVYDIVVKTDGLTLSQVIHSLLKSLKRIWPKTSRTPPKKRFRK
ncbi:MAG: hypothetical protein RLZZ324_1323 [Candidatus Parcubacteria bacterium]|jgi:predicted cytidylate kinase